MDSALNEILLKTGKDAYEVFKDAWKVCTINNEKFDAATCTKIIYTAKDFDIDVFTQETYAEINERIAKGEVREFNYDDLTIKKIAGWHTLSEDEQKYHNLVNWYSLRNKAKYLLDAYASEIMPQFESIEVVQKEINADNGNGDQLKGFIDFIATIKGQGRVVLDNKTSASPYNNKKLDESEQLSLYGHMEGINKIGYAVMVKNLKKIKVKTCIRCGHITESSHKKCNNLIDVNKNFVDEVADHVRCEGDFNINIDIRAQTQLMVQDINVETENKTLDNFDNTVIKINAGEFPMVEDTNQCLRVYGQKCPYYSLCHENKMYNLVEVKEKK